MGESDWVLVSVKMIYSRKAKTGSRGEESIAPVIGHHSALDSTHVYEPKKIVINLPPKHCTIVPCTIKSDTKPKKRVKILLK